MGEGGMTEVMHQDGPQGSQTIVRTQSVALVLQNIQGALHQMHGSKGMGHTGVGSSGVHQICHPKLPDIAEPLKQRMIQQVQDQRGLQPNEPVKGVVEDFVDEVGMAHEKKVN
jgi:hypothetical protein